MNSACHIGAQRPGVALEMRHAEQIADIGHHPVVAELDEMVVVQGVDMVVDRFQHFIHQADIGLELTRAGGVGIAFAIEDRQTLEQAGVLGHCGHSSSLVTVTVSRVR